MKKLLFLVTIILMGYISNAQNFKDVLYLKNGSIVKGVITENQPNVLIKIKTSDDNLFVYKYSEIDKILKEEVISKNPQVANISPVVNEIKSINNDKKAFSFGIFFGYGFSWLGGFSDLTGTDPLMKSSVLNAGINLNYALNDKFGLESGVSYLFNSGNTFSNYSSGVSIKGQIDLDYISVPLLMKYDFLGNLKEKNGLSLGLKAGPKVGINTRASNTIEGSSSGYSVFGGSDMSVNTNIDAVLGLFGQLGRNGFSLDFNYGINKVLENGNGLKNRSIMFLYNYRF